MSENTVAGEQKNRTAATEAKQGEITGQPKYEVRNFDRTIALIGAADSRLSTGVPHGWERKEEGDESILDWKTCNPNLEIPQIRYLSNIGYANGKEHGKRFEENLKLVVSVALSLFREMKRGANPEDAAAAALLTTDDLDGIITKLDYTDKRKRKFNTLPISPVFFLEETEHKNDEKDIDTNQVLDTSISSFTKGTKDEQKQLNDKLKTNTKWYWNYDSDEMKHLRVMAGEFMGSGMNIKCAQMSSRGSWNGSEVAWPNPIDCANCMTFLKETKEGNFIFVVGVWEYASEKKDLKCLRGVWFLHMLPKDFIILWGKNSEKDQIQDVSDKITALKRFNKVKANKKKGTDEIPQNATLKALYYYGNIHDARERCGDGFIEETAKAEKMVYSGCVPLLNVIKDKLVDDKACIRLTPKVQVDKAQARLQCNISTENFKKLVETKGPGEGNI